MALITDANYAVGLVGLRLIEFRLVFTFIEQASGLGLL